MIAFVKNKLWELMKQKNVSLVMIYDHLGNVLWHRGRELKGKHIQETDGFCRSIVNESLGEKKGILEKNVYLTYNIPLSDSAKRLLIKSVLIQPIDPFILYADSGCEMGFSDIEIGMIQMLGEILKDSLQKISEQNFPGGIAGDSQSIKRIKELILKYSVEEDAVLLLGETGVGKTHVAELLHQYSGRKGKFVVAEATTINENLFESIIFGHKKGAFTGAHEHRKGLIDEADGGSLFFDEISEVPISFQGKLLRFIETKKYRILGDTQEKTGDVRIIASSNRDLQEMMKKNLFRQDLFYRLNVLGIKIPSLRERKEDLSPLIMEKKKYLRGKDFGKGFWDELLSYDWPGNIRELFTVLKKAGILCEAEVTGDDLRAIINECSSTDTLQQGKCVKDELWMRIKKGENFWTVVGEPFLGHEINRTEARYVVKQALALASGKYIDSLKVLNLNKSDYKRFMKFIRKHDL